MNNKQKLMGRCDIFKILLLCLCVFASSPSYATYYSGHHYNHHNHHNGYPYHRSYYNYHHRHHSVHYGVHAGISETAAYVVLGVLGAFLLTHIINNNEPNYPKSYNEPLPVKTVYALPKNYQKTSEKTYKYNKNQGWNSLANGNTSFALDVFAVQSQQNLNSGVPKIGFALAAASMNQERRAARIMRKAVRIDANALNVIDISAIRPLIKKLTQNYQASEIDYRINKDTAFMVATLSYLQGDYETAYEFITSNDQTDSARKLKELLKYR